jgi:hypothetical protein
MKPADKKEDKAFSYDGNSEENYDLFYKGKTIARFSCGEDDMIAIVAQLNTGKPLDLDYTDAIVGETSKSGSKKPEAFNIDPELIAIRTMAVRLMHTQTNQRYFKSEVQPVFDQISAAFKALQEENEKLKQDLNDANTALS